LYVSHNVIKLLITCEVLETEVIIVCFMPIEISESTAQMKPHISGEKER